MVGLYYGYMKKYLGVGVVLLAIIAGIALWFSLAPLQVSVATPAVNKVVEPSILVDIVTLFGKSPADIRTQFPNATDVNTRQVIKTPEYSLATAQLFSSKTDYVMIQLQNYDCKEGLSADRKSEIFAAIAIDSNKLGAITKSAVVGKGSLYCSPATYGFSVDITCPLASGPVTVSLMDKSKCLEI